MLPLIPRTPVHSQEKTQSSTDRFIAAGLNPHVAMALACRGVQTTEEATGAYRLLAYHELKGIGEVATKLADAILASHRITVVADYDCDGATACTVAVSGLEAFGATIDFVVPNRFIHGYGLTPSVVDLVRERFPDTRWIVTVDNGIASVAGVETANQHGIGVLVTDHHLPGDTLPPASGIVNPNQPGCPFPSKNLAGVGVMYYVLAATRDELVRRGHVGAKAVNLGQWLDVVALGTVADVVRLDANNRWLVRQGLAQIRRGHMRPGVAALFEMANRDPLRATSQDFGFGLGPRINAAGRLKDMTVGIRCLLAKDDDTARQFAAQLNALNQERKDIENTMKDTAWEAIDLGGQAGRFTRVVHDDAFHEGVIGIVAGRIKEEANTPVVVFAPAQEAGLIKGSGRSIPGVHLRDVLDLVHKRGGDLFTKFGGHAMAAGVTLPAANLARFEALFEEATREAMGGILPRKVQVVDGELPNEAMEEDTAEALAMEVWGQGFEEPLWVGTFSLDSAVLVGRGPQKHLKMVVSRGGREWEAMRFFCDELPGWPYVRLAFRLAINEFRGERKVTLVVAEHGDPSASHAADLDASIAPAEGTAASLARL